MALVKHFVLLDHLAGSLGASQRDGTVRGVTGPGGGDLFIVDNSISGWTALEYLHQWTDVARSFDIATGFFEIGALLALDGRWQQLDKVRILMGDEVSLRTRDAFMEALKQRRHRLDDSLESEKGPNPLLKGVEGTAFPERKPPRVAEYSIRSSYGGLLDMFTEAFEKQNPLFSLAMYYPLAYYTGPDGSINPLEENRQRQVVGLIRILFLKRFESSVFAFEKSLDLLLRKLLAFAEVHSETDDERDRFESWKRSRAEVIGYRPERQLSLNLDGDGSGRQNTEDDAEEDVVPPELLEAVSDLSRDEYDVPAVLEETFADLEQIVRFIDMVRRLEPATDDKLRKLIRLLRTRDLASRKVLVFTEFADTARYVESHLREAGIDGVARIDGGSTVNRAEVIRRFSPYYNGSSSAELAASGDSEIRVLVSTDVLTEGLNLQYANHHPALRPSLSEVTVR